MLLVPEVLPVNLKLIANSGVSALEAITLSALEHYAIESHRTGIELGEKKKFPNVKSLHIDNIHKIAKEVAFLVSATPFDARNAVNRLIENDFIMQFDEETPELYLFLNLQ